MAAQLARAYKGRTPSRTRDLTRPIRLPRRVSRGLEVLGPGGEIIGAAIGLRPVDETLPRPAHPGIAPAQVRSQPPQPVRGQEP